MRGLKGERWRGRDEGEGWRGREWRAGTKGEENMEERAGIGRQEVGEGREGVGGGRKVCTKNKQMFRSLE